METLKKPLKLSDLMAGTTFELNSRDNHEEFDEEIDGMFWNEDNEDLENYKNPCTTSFDEWKLEMIEVLPGVHKKVIKQAPESAKQIDLSRTRITYHRNLYIEGEDHPFDSTYLNGKTDEICIPLKSGTYLEGFLEALETMKEGEQSLFIVCYQKMFKELGCPPRIKERADILCDINVLKVEEVGDQEAIDSLLKDNASEKQTFADVTKAIEETRTRAIDYFATKNYDKATKMYLRILQKVQFVETSSNDEAEQVKQIMIKMHTNLAVCFNKKEEWDNTLTHIGLLEKIDMIDDMPKALYAKGVALTKKGEIDQALVALKKAQKLKPLDSNIVTALEELKERKNTYEGFVKSFSKNLKLA